MTISIRRAEREDVPTLLSLIEALAEFESLAPPDEAARKRFAADGWNDEGRAPRFTAWLAEVSAETNARTKTGEDETESPASPSTSGSKVAAGYAITFKTYSSFLARPTLYLEDIFVLPAFRRQSVGSTMMGHLIAEARSSGCGRVEWSVLDWNTDAQRFYQRLGASHLTEWQTYRLVLESSRYAPEAERANATAEHDTEVIVESPRTLSDLAAEQRAFLASVSRPLVDIDLPSEE